MSRRDRERLLDIQNAITSIRRHIAEEAGDPTPAETRMLHDALLFQFVVIGEAVKNLAEEVRKSEPHIPWTDIAALRNLIAHEYFRIEIARIFDVVDVHLPEMESAIDRMLNAFEGETILTPHKQLEGDD